MKMAPFILLCTRYRNYVMMSNHREREFFMERTLIYTADNSIVSMPVSYFLKQKGFSSQNLVQLKKDPSAVLANGIPCL